MAMHSTQHGWVNTNVVTGRTIEDYTLTYKRSYATIWFDFKDVSGKLHPITCAATLGM